MTWVIIHGSLYIVHACKHSISFEVSWPSIGTLLRHNDWSGGDDGGDDDFGQSTGCLDLTFRIVEPVINL